jgi:hypothetical protein
VLRVLRSYYDKRCGLAGQERGFTRGLAFVSSAVCGKTYCKFTSEKQYGVTHAEFLVPKRNFAASDAGSWYC